MNTHFKLSCSGSLLIKLKVFFEEMDCTVWLSGDTWGEILEEAVKCSGVKAVQVQSSFHASLVVLLWN